ncbi:MAG: hypothetical protein L3K16_08280 [Thermoplasmata archaeon]|nr:hypothetical protein [Thermoplasmata archaeon]
MSPKSRGPRRTITVRDLEQTPFGEFTGVAAATTGKKTFLKPRWADGLILGTIAERSRKTGTIWMLAGDYGTGKTWLLSWLLRDGPSRLEASTGEKWSVVGLSFLPSASPDRLFFEAFFRGSEAERSAILRRRSEQTLLTPSGSEYDRAINAILADPGAWQVLTGHASTFPKRRGGRPFPPWKSPVARLGLFRSFLRRLKDAGSDHVLILVDEFENTVLGTGPSGLQRLTHFFRQLIDHLQSDFDLPKVQIVLSVTADAAKRIKPGQDSQALTRSGKVPAAVQAFQERLGETVYVPPLELDSALDIAKFRIESVEGGDRDPARPYIPFERTAVELAFGASNRLVRVFCVLLEAMYEKAYTTKAPLVTTELAREVLRARGLEARPRS